MQRLVFKQVKKEAYEEYLVNRDVDKVKEKLQKFAQKLQEDEVNYQKQSVQLIDEQEPKQQYLINFEDDVEFLKNYYENVYTTRPEMIKNNGEEMPYDFDFEIDTESYDPWTEYKMLYREIFRKGRSYWIIKSMPEWKFLQIGRPNISDGTEWFSKHNIKRPNMDDSIFTLISIERYFDERLTKKALYRGRSQAIRI